MAKTDKAQEDIMEQPTTASSPNTRAIAAKLALQPKRKVRIPFRDDIKQKFVMVWVNGHSFQIARGVDVEVPQTVYEILVEAGEI